MPRASSRSLTIFMDPFFFTAELLIGEEARAHWERLLRVGESFEELQCTLWVKSPIRRDACIGLTLTWASRILDPQECMTTRPAAITHIARTALCSAFCCHRLDQSMLGKQQILFCCCCLYSIVQNRVNRNLASRANIRSGRRSTIADAMGYHKHDFRKTKSNNV